jgi:precorrin-6B methylase 2
MSKIQWNHIHPLNKLTFGLSGDHAYGEPTFESMAKICHVIKCELQTPLQPGQVLLDWGCGSGKWLIFANQFLGTHLQCVGIECAKSIFELCSKNLVVAREHGLASGSRVIFAQSQTFTTFNPARVVLNYDGGPQHVQRTLKSRIHRTIMRTAFCSSTVDIIVSSKTNLNVFVEYFGMHIYKLGGSVWRAVYVPGLSFGGSHYGVTIWFRVTPTSVAQHRPDSRMLRLLGTHMFANSVILF